jgi:hypothetical protein
MIWKRGILVLVMVGAHVLHAGGDFTTGGFSLLESVGARSSALAEAATALTGDLDAMAYNPATLSTLPRSQATARFQSSVGDVRSGHLGVGRPFFNGGWGVGLSYLDAGSIDLVSSAGTQTKRAQQDWSAFAGGAWRLGDALSVGATVKALRSTLVQDFTAQATTVDAGFLWTTGLEGLRFGAAVQNAGGKLKYRDVSDPLPTAWRAGVGYSLSRGLVKVGDTFEDRTWYEVERTLPVFTLTADAVRDREDHTLGRFGFEWTNWPRAALRAGYTAGGGSRFNGPTFGVGLNFTRVTVDYALRLVDKTEDTHRVSVSYYWGAVR